VTTLPMQQVGATSWAIETHHVGGKVGVVVGSERAIIIDAGADPAEGAAVAATVATLARGSASVLLTHGHWDHVRGLGGMNEMEVLAHEDALPSALTQLDIAARSQGAVGGTRAMLTAIRAPLTVDLGGVTAEVFETPGHAPGAVCVRVVQDGVLFGGDTVVTAIPPVFADGHSTILERTLRAIPTAGVEVLVPGHGRVLRGASEVRDAILRCAGYLAETRQRVNTLFGPHDADEVAAMLALTDRTAGTFDADLVPRADLALRHERMVRALVGEVGLRPRQVVNG
jgi:glyoxylase-like metal-dependent hydrolase (beta-lactamase superfamily II)